MIRSLHCPERQFCNCRPVDRTVGFGNFSSEKCFLLMQYIIIFSPKYGHQHIHKCTLYQKRHKNTDWCRRDNMQFIHLRSLGNISSAGEKSKNVAWKAKTRTDVLLVQQPPCLTTRAGLLGSSVRSVQSGAGLSKTPFAFHSSFIREIHVEIE